MSPYRSTPRAAAWTLRLTATVVIALAAAWLHVGTASAASPAYRSPGYAGKTNFGANLTPQALPSISLGTGKYPNLFVDPSGTAHIVFDHDGTDSSTADTFSVCNLQRGIKTCASEGTIPAPAFPPLEGNSPYLDHDFDGPVPLDVGNQLIVIQRRFPEVFPVPGSTDTSDSNVFEWTSADGGATLTGPGEIGDNQMSGGAIAYGDPAGQSIGTISRTETGGTFFQGTAPGTYTSAQAQLGTGDQAYDGELALDGTRPVAAFADLSGNVFVREYSGQGDVNDPANWSESSFKGFSPQIIGGAAGVFVLSSDSRINGGHLSLRRIVNGAASGAATALGTSASAPAIAEDAAGQISYAFTDQYGVEIRSSLNGVDFSGTQLAAALPSGTSIAHLVVGAAGDGGGFATFVKNPVGAEAVGQVVVSAFGTQVANKLPGLGPLPGGGIGSAVGDKLANSTCSSATFGVVEGDVYPAGGGCFAHDPSDPNLDVTFGTLNLNGLQIIPDPGTKIGIDPKAHTLDTTGPVKVVLTAGGTHITLYHGSLHIQCPNDGPGDTLVDFKPSDLTNLLPSVEGFPIDGDIDIKLAKGGVNIPISLKLPGDLGGVSGAVTLHADLNTGLSIQSVNFMVGDANLGALEIKNLMVKYDQQGDMWSGMAQLLVPAGGSALDAKIEVEFDNGAFKKGSLDVIPGGYPGILLDDEGPLIYLSHVGLSLGLGPPTFGGQAGIGVLPLKPPGEGSSTDYAIRLEGQLMVSFGSPVTFTASTQGYLYTLKFLNSDFVYQVPDTFSLHSSVNLDLPLISFDGGFDGLFDPKDKMYSAEVMADLKLKLGITIDVASVDVHINNQGFGAHVCVTVFCGGVSYNWGDDDVSLTADSPWIQKIQMAAMNGGHGAHAAAASATFAVPSGAPSASLIVHGTGGAPTVTLVGPGGQQVTPAVDGAASADSQQLPIADQQETLVGIKHPQAGTWSVIPAATNAVPIASVAYAIGVPAPTIQAHVTGRGAHRVVHYHATVPSGATISLAEQGGRLMHVIGNVHNGSGTIPFTPAFGPGGGRTLVANISAGGVPQDSQTLASFTVPAPALPGRAAHVRVRAQGGAFSYSFRPPANSVRTLVTIVGTDGRHLQRVIMPGVHQGSVAVIGYGDGVTVSVRGIRVDGVKGPSVSASAKIPFPTVKHPKRHKTTKHKKHLVAA